MRQNNEMKVFQNGGCGQCVLLEHNDAVQVMLIAAIERGEYIVAEGPLENGRWNWGSYHDRLDDALETYRQLTKK